MNGSHFSTNRASWVEKWTVLFHVAIENVVLCLSPQHLSVGFLKDLNAEFVSVSLWFEDAISLFESDLAAHQQTPKFAFGTRLTLAWFKGKSVITDTEFSISSIREHINHTCWSRSLIPLLHKGLSIEICMGVGNYRGFQWCGAITFRHHLHNYLLTGMFPCCTYRPQWE